MNYLSRLRLPLKRPGSGSRLLGAVFIFFFACSFSGSLLKGMAPCSWEPFLGVFTGSGSLYKGQAPESRFPVTAPAPASSKRARIPAPAPAIQHWFCFYLFTPCLNQNISLIYKIKRDSFWLLFITMHAKWSRKR